MTVVVEVLGWLGSGLLVLSLLQKRLLALRVLSLISAAILTGYNLIHGVLPMVVVNAVIVVVNAAYLIATSGGRQRTAATPERYPRDATGAG